MQVKLGVSFALVYLWSVGSACDLTIVIIANIYLISNPKDVVSLKVVQVTLHTI